MSAVADGRVIIEAILDTANVSKNVKNLGSELNGVSWKNIAEGDKKAQSLSGAFKGAGTACNLSLTAPVVAAGAAAFGVASNYEQATSTIQSALGVTREEAEQFRDIGAGIYEGGWGESLDQVATNLAHTKQAMSDLNDADLKTVTQSAMMLEQTFGMDFQESIRGADALMVGFGLSADQSMDLMTTAAQNGMDVSGELGDNLAEYATLFQESGYSASEMFSVLQSGLDAGAYNLDKVNDLVKEFGIRISDGTVAKACTDLGGNFKSMFDEMSASGASNKEIFSALSGEISTLGTEQEKAAAISAIFGSQGEDNGIKVIEAMAGVTDSYQDVEGAAQQAGDAASDCFANKSQSAMRELQGAIEPLGEPLLNIATKVAEVVRSFGEWFASIGPDGQNAALIIAGIVAAIGPVLTIVGQIILILPALVEGIGLVKGAFSALGTVMAANPLGVVLTVVGLLIAAFIYFWNTSEEFRNFWISLWDAVCAKASEAWGWIDTNLIQPFLSGFQGLCDFLNLLFTDPFALLRMAGDGITSWFKSNFPEVSGAVGSAIEGAQAFFNDPFGALVSAAQSAISFIDNIFPGFESTVSSVVRGVQSFFNDPFGTLRDAVTNAVSWVANNFKLSIPNIERPKIPLPYFTVSGRFNLDPFNFELPSIRAGINWYAKGGVFNGASVIGVGEAGPEAVVPLSGNRMKPFADAVASGMGGGRGDMTVILNIEHYEQHTDDDINALADKVSKAIAQKEKARRRACGTA